MATGVEAKLALAGVADDRQPDTGSRAAAMQFESNLLAMSELMNEYRNGLPAQNNETA